MGEKPKRRCGNCALRFHDPVDEDSAYYQCCALLPMSVKGLHIDAVRDVLKSEDATRCRCWTGREGSEDHD